MLFFTTSSLISIFSSSAFFSFVSSFASLGIGCSTFLPLLKVITALTSSILGVGSLEELNSCTAPEIRLCLGRKFSFFLHLLLVSQPRNRILQVIKFLGNIRL